MLRRLRILVLFGEYAFLYVFRQVRQGVTLDFQIPSRAWTAPSRDIVSSLNSGILPCSAYQGLPQPTSSLTPVSIRTTARHLISVVSALSVGMASIILIAGISPLTDFTRDKLRVLRSSNNMG